MAYEDESTFALLPSCQKGWSPIGAPTELEVGDTKGYVHVVVAGIITHTGRFYWEVRPSAFSSKYAIGFLQKTLGRMKRQNLKLIWDGASAHKSVELRKWLETLKKDRLKLFSLPPYSPELNPIENLWAEAKRRLGNFVFKNYTELKEGVEKVMTEIAEDKNYIKSLVISRFS